MRSCHDQDATQCATIYHALGVHWESRVTKDGVTKPLSTGTPLLDLFG